MMNGGIGQGQCGVKVNGGIEKGQVVGEAGVWLWVREEVVLQGCKLYEYLTGLQALPYRVASSTLQGCKLYLTGL